MKQLRMIVIAIGILSLIGSSFALAQEEEDGTGCYPRARDSIRRVVVPIVPGDDEEDWSFPDLPYIPIFPAQPEVSPVQDDDAAEYGAEFYRFPLIPAEPGPARDALIAKFGTGTVIDQTVDADEAMSEVDRSVPIRVRPSTVVRSRPNDGGDLVITLFDDLDVEAIVRDPTGNYVGIRTPDGTLGWIRINEVQEGTERILDLQIADPSSISYNPFPPFPSCDLPNGLVFVTPPNERAHVMLNGVLLEVEGTAIFTLFPVTGTGANDTLAITLVDGELVIGVRDNPQTLDQPGSSRGIPLDGQGNATGGASEVADEMLQGVSAAAATICEMARQAINQALDCSPIGEPSERHSEFLRFLAEPGAGEPSVPGLEEEATEIPDVLPEATALPDDLGEQLSFTGFDGWNDPVDCATHAATDAAPGTYTDISSMEVHQTDAGFQVRINLVNYGAPPNDLGIVIFGVSHSTDGVNTVNHILTTREGELGDGGEVGADGQILAGTRERLNLSPDRLILTLDLAEEPKSIAVATGGVSICDEFPNGFTFGDPNTYAAVPPLLSPEEVDALIARSAEVEQIALSPQDTGESADTIRERSYVIEDILQCMTFGGEITPESLAGFVTVRVGNHPTSGRYFVVEIDPLVREALDDAGVSVRLLVHTYDDAESQTGAFIVEYGFGEFSGGPTDDGVTVTRNEYASSRGYRDGFVQVALDPTTVEAVLSSPSSSAPTFTDDQSTCPGTSEVM